MKLLSLSTGKIITRDSFKILPIPQSAIDRMNEISSKEGRHTALHSDSTIVRNDPVDTVDMFTSDIAITPHEGDDPTCLPCLPIDLPSQVQQYNNPTDPIQSPTYNSDIQSDIPDGAHTADDKGEGEGCYIVALDSVDQLVDTVDTLDRHPRGV